MSFITRDELRKYVQEYDYVIRLNKGKRFTEATADVVVFLSHSHKDTELIQLATEMLIAQDVKIYIDTQDSDLPEETSHATAYIIKNRITECQKFILIDSSNARKSIWIPWELGYADGHKKDKNVAIFPIQEYEGEWSGNEYIGLYQTIQKPFNDEWKVIGPGRSYIGSKLKDWLRDI